MLPRVRSRTLPSSLTPPLPRSLRKASAWWSLSTRLRLFRNPLPAVDARLRSLRVTASTSAAWVATPRVPSTPPDSPHTSAEPLLSRHTVTWVDLVPTLCPRLAAAVAVIPRLPTTTCLPRLRTTGKCPTSRVHPAWHSSSHRARRARHTTVAVTAQPSPQRSLTCPRCSTLDTLSTWVPHRPCTLACLTSSTLTPVTTSPTPRTTTSTPALVLLKAPVPSTPTRLLAPRATTSLPSCRLTWRALPHKHLTAPPRASVTPLHRASHTHRLPRPRHRSKLLSRAPTLSAQ